MAYVFPVLNAEKGVKPFTVQRLFDLVAGSGFEPLTFGL